MATYRKLNFRLSKAERKRKLGTQCLEDLLLFTIKADYDILNYSHILKYLLLSVELETDH